MAEFITKDMPFECKVNLQKRQWEGYASTFDRDQIDDIIEPGAFKKTLRERGPMGTNDIKCLWEHRSPFGMPVKMYEDEIGLYVVGEASDTQENKDRLVYMRDGVVKSMSIGFSIPEGKSWFEDDNWTRHIEEVKLYEFSPVTFPMNEQAVIVGVAKHLELAQLVDVLGKDEILAKGRELPDINIRQLDTALDTLRDVKTMLTGTEEEKRALKARRGMPFTQKAEDTSPKDESHSEEKDVDPDIVKEVQSVYSEMFMLNRL